MKQLTGACIIGQSGGPTAVINASAQGVIQTALKADCITHVWGPPTESRACWRTSCTIWDRRTPGNWIC